MEIHVYTFHPIDERMYIVVHQDKALVVDPFDDEEGFKLLEKEGVQEVTILLTHEHYDHISGVNEFKKRYHCEVICSEICGINIQDPVKNISKYYDALFMSRPELYTKPTPPYQCEATKCFQGELSFSWAGHEIRLVETPGHSPGCICIILDSKYIFTGDSLLKENKISFPMYRQGMEQYEAITKPFLEQLSSDIYVYPGHGESGYMREFTID